MPHDLTDVDEYTIPITVPDGTDSRSNAAEVVQGIAQALANRTFLLYSHAAWHDAPNSFTGGSSTFADVLNVLSGIAASNPNASEAALVQYTSAASDPSAGNKWKKIVEAAVSGATSDVSLWAGTFDGGEAQFALTLNTYWNAATQLWNQSDSSRPSFGLLINVDISAVGLMRKPAASAPWAAWGTPNDSILQVSHGSFEDVVVTDNVTVDTGDFAYASPRTEAKHIPLATGLDVSLLAPSPAVFVGQVWTMLDNTIVDLPLIGPIGGTLNVTEAILENASGSNLTYTMRLIQVQNANFTTGAGPTQNTVDSVTAVINAGTSIVVPLDWGGLVVDANDTHIVQFQAAASAPDAFTVKAVRFFSDRPGPSRT